MYEKNVRNNCKERRKYQNRPDQIIGNFSSTVGAKIPADFSFFGKFGLGARNQKGANHNRLPQQEEALLHEYLLQKAPEEKPL